MTFHRLLGGAVTTLLVVAALLLGAWFVFQAQTGAQLITFRTGSMAPTMPQGAIGVGLPVQASEMRVGDVITVQREGRLPVTHRIIEMSGTGDTRTLVMQGDANERVDPRPYEVTGGLKIVASVPYVGSVLRVMQHPIGRGMLIIGVGLLVVWAFWPVADSKPYRARHREGMQVRR